LVVLQELNTHTNTTDAHNAYRIVPSLPWSTTNPTSTQDSVQIDDATSVEPCGQQSCCDRTITTLLQQCNLFSNNEYMLGLLNNTVRAKTYPQATHPTFPRSDTSIRKMAREQVSTSTGDASDMP
jgi:hypothetical protein